MADAKAAAPDQGQIDYETISAASIISALQGQVNSLQKQLDVMTQKYVDASQTVVGAAAQ